MATYGAQESCRPYGSNKCSSHTGQEVSLVCTNCDSLVCVRCVASPEHIGHVFDNLNEVVREETAKIQRTVNTNENTDLAKIRNGLSDVKKEMAKNKDKHNDISALIMSRVMEIKDEADKQAKILLRDCNKNEKENHDGLLKYQTTLTNQQRECEKQIKMFKKTLQSGTEIEVFDSRNSATTFVLAPMHALNLAEYQPGTSVSELVKQALGPLNVPLPQTMKEAGYTDGSLGQLSNQPQNPESRIRVGGRERRFRVEDNSSVAYPEDLKDKSTKAVRNQRDHYRTKAKKFFLKGEELYRLINGNLNGAKVVVKGKEQDILAEFHGSAFGGHSGVNRTTEAIKQRYWWTGLTDDVKSYIRQCAACQKSDPLKPAPNPDLKPIKVSGPFELVGVDLIGPLTTTESGMKYIFTATDYFTKWVEAFAIPSKTALDVARCFKKLFAQHGAMNAILTDQGREFVNQVNEQLCKEWNVTHKLTAAYHPQTNGLDERTNQTLKASIRKMVNDHQTDWDVYLEGALFAQRSKPQSTTKYSPFFLLYGREAVYPSQLPRDFGGDDTQPNVASVEQIEEFVSRQQETNKTTEERVHSNIKAAQEKQRKEYRKRTTKGRTAVTFKVGDDVLVHNSRKASTKGKSGLGTNYGGPYQIVTVDGKCVTLRNSKGQVLAKSVNIDRLKIFVQDKKLQQQTTDHPTQDQEQQRPTQDQEQKRPTQDQEQQRPTQDQEQQRPTQDQEQQHRDKATRYFRELKDNGSLDDLVETLNKFELSKPSVRRIHEVETCPIQTFILEVSDDAADEVEAFARVGLPLLRHLVISLSAKTQLTMLLASVCVRAASLFVPPSLIVETLRAMPGHMDHMPATSLPDPSSRLFVGGEVIEEVDMQTLHGKHWINDKIINAFLGLICAKHNATATEGHVYVLPSYTAVLWEEGRIDHWFFKKVQFSKYKYVLLPININRQHWVLMVVTVRDRTITVLDSTNGQTAVRWAEMWRQFITKRETHVEDEKFGEWAVVPAASNRQKDGSSCGVFVMMNAECIIKDTPVQVMRQVHCGMYRGYIHNYLINNATTKATSSCDMMPRCTMEKKGISRWIRCDVCGRWFHTKCHSVFTKAAISDDFECCFCEAIYR